MRSSRGQASLEYVGVLGLLVLLLAGAAVGVTVPDLPRAVLAKARLALCVVGGDICTAADAAAAGLAPCVVAAERRSQEHGLTVAIVRAGRYGLVQVERRSDGSAMVTKLGGGSLDASAGFSVKLGPVLHAGGSVSGGYSFRAGRAWEVPDEAALAALLEDLDHAPPRPTVRYLEGGRQTAAGVLGRAGTEDTGVDLALLDGSVRQALGRRVGPDGTTFYFGFDGGAAGAIAKLTGLPSGGRWLAEWRAAKPPVLTLRREVPGRGEHEVVETIARLVLSDPAARRDAERLVLLQAGGPLAVVLGRRLQERLVEQGAVEIHTYEEKTESDGYDAGVQVIAGLGADERSSVTRRKLLDARVVRPDRARRADCLGR